MSLPFRVQGRLPNSDAWQKLGRFRNVPEAKAAADMFEAKTGGETRIRGRRGDIINVRTNSPDDLAPSVTMEQFVDTFTTFLDAAARSAPPDDQQR
jgi:hypothetical protein